MHPNTPCSPHPRGRRRACRGRPREGSGIRAVARSLRGCLDDHVARCVVGYHRSAADDDNRAFPGTLVREESHLLSRPIVPERLGCRGSTISLDPAAAGLDTVGLHPREPVHKVLELATPGAYPLHDHHPATRWHFDGAGAGPRGPGGRSIADRRPAASHRIQDPIAQQTRPVEIRVVPRNIVGAQHRGAGDRRGDPLRRRRLSAPAASVHGDDRDRHLVGDR